MSQWLSERVLTPASWADISAKLATFTSYSWTLREGHFTGDYLLGKSPDGTKIKIVRIDERTLEVEIEFKVGEASQHQSTLDELGKTIGEI